MDDTTMILAIAVGVIVGILIYFLPTIVGFKKHKLNKISIFLLNLFLGWSLVGWVIALVWATKHEQNIKIENNNYINHNNE